MTTAISNQIYQVCTTVRMGQCESLRMVTILGIHTMNGIGIMDQLGFMNMDNGLLTEYL
jgi:hypothetical protein